jgi:DNA-binding NtrC family response regulator
VHDGAAVARANGNLSAAARMVGATRRALRYRMKQCAIDTKETE